MPSAHTQSTGPDLVVAEVGCVASSNLEDLLEQEGYESTRISAPEELPQVVNDESDGKLAIFTPIEEQSDDFLHKLEQNIEDSKLIILSPQDLEPAVDQLAELSRSERILWISGDVEGDAKGIRRFVRNEGYTWADELPSERRGAACLLGRESDPTQVSGRQATKLHEIVAELSEHTDLQELLEAGLQKGLDLLESDAGSLYLWDETSETLVLKAAQGPDQEERRGLRQELGEGLAGWVAEERRGVLVTDARKMSKLDGRKRGRYPEHSCLALPLTSEDKLLGVLCVTMRRDQGPYRPGELHLGREFAQQLGYLISPLSLASELRNLNDSLISLFQHSSKLLARKSDEMKDVQTLSSNILEALPVGVIAYNERLKIEWSNATARDILRINDRVASTVGLEDRLDVDGQTWRNQLTGVVRAGNDFHHRKVACGNDDDDKRWVDIQGSPLYASGDNCVGGILVIQDVTHNVETEQKLISAERLAAIGEVAAKVAHELNNPLDGILRFLNLARRKLDDEPEKTNQYLEECRRGLLRMSDILTELLAFSRRKRDSDKPRSVSQTVRDCIGLFEQRMKSQDVELEFDVPTELPASQLPELQEVLSNVIRNALEAMDDGTLTVKAEEDEEHVHITVSDTGPGVPEDVKEKIFQPFFTTKDSSTSTGLGLAMSRDALRRRGGDIKLCPSETGATFRISVPVTEGNHA